MNFSHKNGETEPPTRPGHYWLRGVRKHGHKRIRLRHLLHVVRASHTTFEVEWGGVAMPIELYEGQWWGPVCPPWEDTP
jgi:hypothetical protein